MALEYFAFTGYVKTNPVRNSISISNFTLTQNWFLLKAYIIVFKFAVNHTSLRNILSLYNPTCQW